MEERLRDPRRARLFLVTTLEELPVDETLDLVQGIENDAGFSVAGVFVNKSLAPLFSREKERLGRWIMGKEDPELSRLSEDPQILRQDLEFYLQWYEIETQELKRLKNLGLPLFFLPWLPLLSPSDLLKGLYPYLARV
jgi:hypothetical protein